MRTWTKQENEELKRVYGVLPTATIAHILARSSSSVYQQAQELGLTRAYWSEDDDAYLIQHYGNLSAERIAAMLKRPVNGVYKRARELDLMGDRGKWTREQLSILERHFTTHTNEQLAEMTGHTPNQVRNKAGVLGLRKKPLPDETMELLAMMKDEPNVVDFFSRQLRVKPIVIERALAALVA